MMRQHEIEFRTAGRGTMDLTAKIEGVVSRSGIRTGLCNLFLQHTSASLILCENADPTVRRDLESFMSRLVPDGDPRHTHSQEGPDDMPAHIRSILTQSSLTVPISSGRLALGTWQGLYLWEHRHHGHLRRVTVTVHGERDD